MHCSALISRPSPTGNIFPRLFVRPYSVMQDNLMCIGKRRGIDQYGAAVFMRRSVIFGMGYESTRDRCESVPFLRSRRKSCPSRSGRRPPLDAPSLLV
ncbi:hypothetical protein M404DRAFT_637709 [Pisolithus tinctorius Marx 270]|uniref:Uncharacterized protein n=1 Tax=Pisolithus tinctorius Marx 270 TaxID=870435 RepID=A0A0C3J1I6_PISTI|nr:hypothetical protein M404DRAFT_637709 [Pisolithus tinctorius Marx 270]